MAKNFWTDAEDDIIRENYPDLGARGCAELLPGRSPVSIRRRASNIDVQSNRIKQDYEARQNHEPAWPVPEHDYTAADEAVRHWRMARPVEAVFAPSLGLRA